VGVKTAPRPKLAPDIDPVGDHEEQVRAALDEAEAIQAGEQIRLGQPTLDRMLVEEIAAGEKTRGGIFLPPSARRSQNAGPRGKPVRGRVLRVGQGMILDDGSILDVFSLYGIRPGSIITWHEFGGSCLNTQRGLHIVSAQDTIYVENFDIEEEVEED